jgi:hypothetical protein
MADSQQRSAAAIWRQSQIPVIYRRGRGLPLMVRLPYSPDNFDWLRNENRRKPEYDRQYKCWYVPSSWFDDLIRRTLQKFGRVYVIQPFRALEKCAPACWNAQGFECECSCLGMNHGSSASGNWWIISETFAMRWHERELACRLIERRPPPAQLTSLVTGS